MKQLLIFIAAATALWAVTGCEDIDLLAHVDGVDTESAGGGSDTSTTGLAETDVGTDSETTDPVTNGTGEAVDSQSDMETETVYAIPTPPIIGGWQWHICEAMPLIGFDKVKNALNPWPELTPPMQLAGTSQFVTMYTESELDYLFYTSVNSFPSNPAPTNYHIYSAQGDSVRALPLSDGRMAYVRRTVDDDYSEYQLELSDLKVDGVKIEIPLPGHDLDALPLLIEDNGIIALFSQLDSAFTFGAGTAREATLASDDGSPQNYLALYTLEGEFLKAQFVALPFHISGVAIDRVSASVIAAGKMSHVTGEVSLGIVRMSMASLFAFNGDPVVFTWESQNVANSADALYSNSFGVDVVADELGGFFLFTFRSGAAPVQIYDDDVLPRVMEAATPSQIIAHFTAANENDFSENYILDEDPVSQGGWPLTRLIPAVTPYTPGLLFLAGTVSDAFLSSVQTAGTAIEPGVSSGTPVMAALNYSDANAPPHFDVIRGMPGQIDIRGLSVTDPNMEIDGSTDVVISGLYKKDVQFAAPVLTPDGEATTLAASDEGVVLLKVCDILAVE